VLAKTNPDNAGSRPAVEKIGVLKEACCAWRCLEWRSSGVGPLYPKARTDRTSGSGTAEGCVRQHSVAAAGALAPLPSASLRDMPSARRATLNVIGNHRRQGWWLAMACVRRVESGRHEDLVDVEEPRRKSMNAMLLWASPGRRCAGNVGPPTFVLAA